MNRFEGLEAFVAVAESGSFTAAAARLQTAKSSVSETVRALEDRLGVRLFDRTTRKVRPTEQGRLFYARCRRLLDEANAAQHELQQNREFISGTLRVAGPDGFTPRYLIPGLARFLSAHPGLSVDMVESPAASNLIDESCDLAIRISPALSDAVIARRLATSTVIIVASPNYLGSAGLPVHPSDLARHRCVGFSPLAWRDSWRLGDTKVSVAPRLLTNTSESLRASALAGLGLVALPDWLVADALAAGSLTRVLGDFTTPSAGIYAVYPSNRLLAPKVRAFVDHVAEELAARGIAP